MSCPSPTPCSCSLFWYGCSLFWYGWGSAMGMRKIKERAFVLLFACCRKEIQKGPKTKTLALRWIWMNWHPLSSLDVLLLVQWGRKLVVKSWARNSNHSLKLTRNLYNKGDRKSLVFLLPRLDLKVILLQRWEWNNHCSDLILETFRALKQDKMINIHSIMVQALSQIPLLWANWQIGFMALNSPNELPHIHTIEWVLSTWANEWVNEHTFLLMSAVQIL